MVNLTTADVSDSAGAQAICDAVRERWPWLRHLFTDGACHRTKLFDEATFENLSWRSCAARTVTSRDIELGTPIS